MQPSSRSPPAKLITSQVLNTSLSSPQAALSISRGSRSEPSSVLAVPLSASSPPAARASKTLAPRPTFGSVLRYALRPQAQGGSDVSSSYSPASGISYSSVVTGSSPRSMASQGSSSQSASFNDATSGTARANLVRVLAGIYKSQMCLSRPCNVTSCY
jgi:hypothetical protein